MEDKDKLIAELKAENDKLKEEINKLDKKHEDYCNIMYWQMKEQMDKYHQTLQEIKNIAEDAYENESEYQATGVYSEIIQLINKAEEE
jgi:uncharacterized protein YigA (DUF484 family)